jgi:CBS domain-containing protein
MEKHKHMEKTLKQTTVSELMSRFAITTTEETTLSDLAHLMMRFKISGVPVLSSQGEIIGVVTATDLFNMLKDITVDIEQGKDISSYGNIPVSKIMTRNVCTVNEATTLFEAVKLMCAKNIHTLPVTRGLEIVGIIGRRDVINACYAIQGGDASKKNK